MDPILNIPGGILGGDGSGPDPVITLQPVDAVVSFGEDAVFVVDATGTEPITYQWYEYISE